MRLRPVCAVLTVIALAALIGCKKGAKTTDAPAEETGLGDKTGIPPIVSPHGGELALAPPPAQYPDTTGGKIAQALDEATVLAEKLQPWEPRLQSLEKALPKEELTGTGQPKGIDASADRALIDAGFERLWRVVRNAPHHHWESFVDGHGQVYVETKRGTYEQGRAHGASLMARPSRTRVSQATDMNPAPEWAEINLTNGTSAKWVRSDGIWVWGRVQFSQRFEVVAHGGIGVKLSGSVGELDLRMNSAFSRVFANLDELKAAQVVLSMEGALSRAPSMVRIGPGVASVRYDAAGYRGWLFVRGNPTLNVTTQSKATGKHESRGQPRVTLIRY